MLHIYTQYVSKTCSEKLKFIYGNEDIPFQNKCLMAVFLNHNYKLFPSVLHSSFLYCAYINIFLLRFPIHSGMWEHGGFGNNFISSQRSGACDDDATSWMSAPVRALHFYSLVLCRLHFRPFIVCATIVIIKRIFCQADMPSYWCVYTHLCDMCVCVYIHLALVAIRTTRVCVCIFFVLYKIENSIHI